MNGGSTMSERFHTARAEGISVTLDLEIGHLRDLRVTSGATVVAPLHLAPWAGDPDLEVEADTAPNLTALGGDFLCAPFGANDVEPAPTHGWPANARWSLVSQDRHPEGGTISSFALERPVFGARVTKELILRDGHPFLYQRHLFEGGHGRHHRGPSRQHPHAGGRAPQLLSEGLCGHPLDPPRDGPGPRPLRPLLPRSRDRPRRPAAGLGRHRRPPLLPPRRAPRGLPHAGRGGRERARLDRRSPQRCPRRPPGPQGPRRAAGHAPLVLQWRARLSPWSGRHTAVLGVEDARCWSLYGHAASIADNPLARSGVPTSFALAPGFTLELRHVIGAMPAPAAWTSVASVAPGGEGLRVEGEGGAAVVLRYDASFLAGRG